MPDTIEYGEPFTQGPTLIDRPGESPDEILRRLKEFKDKANASKLQYNFLNQNSNIFAYSALVYADTPTPLAYVKNSSDAWIWSLESGVVYVSGWGHRLPI